MLLLAIECGATLVVMFFTGLGVILAARSPYEGMLSVIGWLVWSAAAALLTTAVVALIGSPIRLIPRLRRWWIDNGEVMVAGAPLGGALIVVSFLLGQEETIRAASSQWFEMLMPNGWLLLAGWVLLSFSCAHLRWPRRWAVRPRALRADG
ncbi:hypothetical protein ACFVWR_15670 [Leifsonia sp. NPDC058292]|uniref:hypothetical protein n=1 Tax=Leifsonia sp. NPDC058292 TaxID=3346428 RepID=UPI0036D7C940